MKRITVGLLLGATILSAGRPASACGGLFCDRPPSNPFDPLPIAQSGENIVFGVIRDPTSGAETVEAHIQIFYKGPADKFSWIVPVDAAPTVGVGTDRMFTVVAAATQPSFRLQPIVEGTCIPEPIITSSGTGGSTAAGPGFYDASADGASHTGVQVLSMGAVGPYEQSVIHSTNRSSADLIKWLTDNGYYVGPDAVSIIDEYVLENKYFVAVRLQNGKDVQAIQPVVLKFSGADPCVPLRLTAIAALNDLSINLWVLGDSRAVPKNYFELTINEVKLDWFGGGRNYSQLVKEAADEAGGNAFIAEYAGTARILDRTLWPNPQINLASLRTQIDPPSYLSALISQGFAGTPQLLSLLRVYIPEPQVLKDMGLTEAAFYNNIAFYWTQNRSAFAPFDPNKLTDEIDKALVAPLRDGQTLFDAHPYLTRLATFISPIEMTRDPIFIFNSDLPALSNVHQATARIQCGDRQYRFCEAPVRVDLPSGRSIWQEHYCGGAGKVGQAIDGPSLLTAYQRAEGGEGTTVADNTKLVGDGLTAHNKAVAAALVLPASALMPDGSPKAPIGVGPKTSGVGGGGSGCRLGGGAGAPAAAIVVVFSLLALVWRRR